MKIAANEKRTGDGSRRTRLKLARLPVRVLSFDLGHRYAAACAVWGCGIPTKEMDRLCAQADKVVRDEGDLYRHLKYKTDKQDKKSGKAIHRTVVWRRIGPDKLADKSPHPTAWAPLERQFLIRLQGEDSPARFPHVAESSAFRKQFTLLTGLDDEKAKKVAEGKRVDALMSLAADEVKAALRRHGDVARIANAFQSKVKELAGGRQYNFFAQNPGVADDSPEKRAENYRRFLLDGLVRWYDMRQGQFRDRAWRHAGASSLWDSHIAPLLKVPVAESSTESNDESPAERKSRLKEVEKVLEPVAAKLAEDSKLRATLSAEFTKFWHDEETQWVGKEGHLRWLRGFLLPRLGKRPKLASPEYEAWKQRARAIRHVGGLSIDRISTILRLYQVMQAYHSRPEPDNLRAGIERIERESGSGTRFGQRILNTLDHLRENRIKQLASRLVEAALGIGSEDKKKHWERGTKRPRKRIDDARFTPCHAIIGEDLENYRPEQSRLRSENRRIRDWAARNVRKYIIEGCELNGLYFDEVSPRWTSWQDSRTGAPGIRCEDVTLADFQKRRKMIASAMKGGYARDRFIAALAQRYSENGNTKSSANPLLRIPNKKGELFVSADAQSSVANGIQADLNAAANIGLRALMDPDWPGAWWYVLVKSADGTTSPKDCPGCWLFEAPMQLLNKGGDTTEKTDEEAAVNPIREKTYAWSDIASPPLSRREEPWKSTPEYWNRVEACVVHRWAKALKLKI